MEGTWIDTPEPITYKVTEANRQAVKDLKAVCLLKWVDPKWLFSLWYYLQSFMVKGHENYPISVVKYFDVLNKWKETRVTPNTTQWGNTNPKRAAVWSSNVTPTKMVVILTKGINESEAWIGVSLYVPRAMIIYIGETMLIIALDADVGTSIMITM